MAEKQMRRLAESAGKRFDVRQICPEPDRNLLPAGETSVIVRV